MRNAKSGNIKNRTHFSSHLGWVKENGKWVNFVGWQMLPFLGHEFIPNHRKCLQQENDAIFG